MSGEYGEPSEVLFVPLPDGGTIAVSPRRIAACVNALNGVSTAAIEAGCVAELVDHCRALLNAYSGGDYGMPGLRELLKPFEGMSCE